MNDAVQAPADALLTTSDLAARPEFTLGGVIISPSTRALRGPEGSVDVEPRVMQVLVVLADATGQVVTRETLFNRCWGGVYVGDDSLNRAVAAVRRAVAAVGGRFEIDTIPRTGYRLTVPKGDGGDLDAEQPIKALDRISRRGALIGGSAVLAAGTAGFWWDLRSRSDRRFDQLMANAEKSMRNGAREAPTAKVLEDALSIRPNSARAWGLLALLKSGVAQALRGKDASAVVEEAEAAARKALAIDAREPNALLAMFELQGSTLDWTARDHELRRIIAIDPGNVTAIGELVLLLQAAGLNRESWSWNERALTLEPLSVDFLSKRALKLWIAGRTSEADKVVDQVRTLYPDNPGAWWVRFLILALTDRAPAARAMLDPDPTRLGSADDLALWQPALAALDRGSPESIAKARNACFKAAESPGGSVADAVMILSALGQVDSAFDAVNGFLLSRGSVVRGDRPRSGVISDAVGRINTQWLFTPPCAAMRADRRFLPLCDAMGLGDYWRRRGVTPDYLKVER